MLRCLASVAALYRLTQTLDLGEATPVLADNVVPWPGTLPEQVSAVQSILAASTAPLAPADVARAFKGKRAATVRPVLDALAGIGMARRALRSVTANAYAAFRISSLPQISTSALVRSAIIASLCAGPGVKRRRSVPRGTVG